MLRKGKKQEKRERFRKIQKDLEPTKNRLKMNFFLKYAIVEALKGCA